MIPCTNALLSWESASELIARLVLLASTASLVSCESPSIDALGLVPAAGYVAALPERLCATQSLESATALLQEVPAALNNAKTELQIALRILRGLEGDIRIAPEVQEYLSVLMTILGDEDKIDVGSYRVMRRLAQGLNAARIEMLSNASSDHARTLYGGLIAPNEADSNHGHLVTIAQPEVSPLLDIATAQTPKTGAQATANVIDMVQSHSDELTRYLDNLIEAVDSEPVEDGIDHPAEAAIAAFLQSCGDDALYRSVFGPNPQYPGRCASVLRLLGRSKEVEPALRAKVVAEGLASLNIEIRDSAVQAAELWDDATLADVLLSHKESTPWLADYIEKVAADLTG